MSTREFGSFFEDRLDIVDLQRNLRWNQGGLCNASRCMVVVMMWCPLDVMMVMDWLAWTILRDASVSSVEWSGSVRYGEVILGLVVMMVVMVMAVSLAMLPGVDMRVYLLMMWRVVVMVTSMVVLVALRAPDARGCAPAIIAVRIKDILVLDSLYFSALL